MASLAETAQAAPAPEGLIREAELRGAMALLPQPAEAHKPAQVQAAAVQAAAAGRREEPAPAEHRPVELRAREALTGAAVRKTPAVWEQQLVPGESVGQVGRAR